MGNATERGIKLPDSVSDKAKTLQTGGLNLRIRVFREFTTTSKCQECDTVKLNSKAGNNAP